MDVRVDFLGSPHGTTIKTSCFAQSFQHIPRTLQMLMHANEWKIMSDLFILINMILLKVKLSNDQELVQSIIIRTQIHPSKPKREITNITNSKNLKRLNCQPSEQLFPKR